VWLGTLGSGEVLVSSKNSSLQAAPLSEIAPKVSVIIPTYNSARFLPEALESVFSQNYADYEVIVVDDGSTDGTTAVLQPYAGRIRYLYQPNAGSAAARNTGLDMGRGEYIVFLDADDLLLPGKLREQAAFLEVRASIGAVHSGWHLINEAGEHLSCVEPWRWAPTLDLETWLRFNPMCMGSMMFRQFWLESIGYFDPEFRQAQDSEMLLRLLLQGCQIEWIYRPTLSYRVYPESTIRKNAAQQYRFTMGVLDKFFQSPNLPEKVRAMENETRYRRMVWLSRHLFSCGRREDMILSLREAFAYSSWPPAQTAFAIFKTYLGLRAHGLTLDQIKQVWPYLRESSGMDEADWQQVNCLFRWWASRNTGIEGGHFNDFTFLWHYWLAALQQPPTKTTVFPESYMDWWVYVWWYVIRGNEARVYREVEARFGSTSTQQLVQYIQLCLVMGSNRVEPKQVVQFWQQLVTLGLVATDEAKAVTAIFLSFFGQSVLNRRWPHAWQSLKLALYQGLHPLALRAWAGFVYNTWHYLRNYK
jgi:glycosyltransferase involved in cell wall biosynthesis